MANHSGSSGGGSGSGSGCGPVPARWMDCPRKGALLMNKFLPFKTPLSSKYDDQVPEANRFPPKMLFTSMKSYKLKLGLWINLTFTDRYYDDKEIEAMDCKYIRLQCRGHGETPSVDQTKMFVDLVSRYVRNNPLECIGVHCTHGFNRTGFLLVAYMVEDMDCDVEFAIKEFAKIRPPGIYKQDYINELFKRYGDIECSIIAPMLPSWHTGSDDSNENESSGSKTKRNRNLGNKSSILMPEINTVFLFTTEPRASKITKLIQQMCGVKDDKFPGSQPVSMGLENLAKLTQKPYRVSWKADGTRFLMLIDGPDEVYLFDRDNCPYHVKNLRFPRSSNEKDHITSTLLDGEMVIDKIDGASIPRFLIYDIVVFEGQPIGKEAFNPNRINCIHQEIISPRYRAMEKRLIDKSTEPFSVRLKPFFDLTHTPKLLSEDFIRSLHHEPDGLIFQPSKDPYMPLTCEDVLKWKPLSMNSVDFKLKIVVEQKPGMLRSKIGQLYVGQLDVPFATMKFVKALRDLDNKIIECKFENNNWVFMRERTDKSFPNSYTTAKSVVNSILNPVTEEILMNCINYHRFIDDTEKMPPPGNLSRASSSQSEDAYVDSELLLMPEIRNVSLVTNEDKASKVIKLIYHLCEFHDSGYPGCQPASMNIDNLSKLNKKPYFAAWKGDGMRMLMLIEGRDDIFLFDMNNQLYQARNLKFPKRNNPEKHIGRTLLDGEMVIDYENDRRVPRFYIYDIILFDRIRIREMPFIPDRLNCINTEILAPRCQGVDKMIEPFSIRLQKFYHVSSIQKLLSANYVRSLLYEPTALIFQSTQDPYISGMTEEVLRWKLPKLSTAVFRLKITTDQEYGSEPIKIGELYVKQSDIPFSTIPYTSDIKELDNKIIECKFEDYKWIYVRQRPDRSCASSFDTASAIVEIIEDPVTEDALVDYIENHRYIEDNERMPPPKRQKF